MSFPYKCVAMIGATSGIGAGLADRLVQEGCKVIAIGRRQEKLDEFVRRHGPQKASAIKYDINNTKDMDEFVKNITTANPELDCLFLNAGVQHVANLTQPKEFSLQSFHSEIETNFSRFVDLTMKFLPFLMGKNTPTSIVYTTSNLAIVPAVNCPAYSASKAALNSFILCLREQIRDSTVKVIELSPPPVQTELHDYMGEEKGRAFGMPLNEFTNEAFKGLASGSDQIVIGSIGPADAFNEIVDKRRMTFSNLSAGIRSRS